MWIWVEAMFCSSVSTDAAGREDPKAPSRENIKGIRETIARYGADACNGPNRLTRCCTQFKPFGNKMFCFRNFHIIKIWMPLYNANAIHKESWPREIWIENNIELISRLGLLLVSIIASPAPRIVHYFVPSARKGSEEFMPRECIWLLLSKEILSEFPLKEFTMDISNTENCNSFLDFP